MAEVARRTQEDLSLSLVQALASMQRPLDTPQDEDSLLAAISRARVVLLGEATHGTHEFYELRARLTQRMIAEHGFSAVVVEADWPDAWRVNRYVRNWGDDANADEALSGFRRFPTWMWRNTVVRDFVEWLRQHNATHPSHEAAGFFGMDLYSLYSSMGAVLAYLDKTDPPGARRARARYACFDHFGEDSHAYGYGASFGLQPHCEDEVVEQLREMLQQAALSVRPRGPARDEAFQALQNARLVRNAEEYYRTMFHRRISSWNLRDSHMVETLQAIETHLSEPSGTSPRLVVWAHNSHLGDARATGMGEQGEWNVGQLVRERWGAQAMLVGFSTYNGTVTAAPGWDLPAQRRHVRDGLPGSWEDLFHRSGRPRFWLNLRDDDALVRLLSQRRLQRAIGVVYLPDSERVSHYVETQLPGQFDMMIHIDRTEALTPLEAPTVWQADTEPPETFPSGL